MKRPLNLILLLLHALRRFRADADFKIEILSQASAEPTETIAGTTVLRL
jgi:hypothetical protein